MPIHKTQLANGLQVILQESHVAPVASFFVFYRVGSRNERPGLTGLKIVPLPDIKFEIQQGDWIDFGRLVGANINTRVVVTFAVRSDGTTEILQVDARGYPTAEITVVSAIRSWRYQKSCLTAEFTFVFHGRRGFYISREEYSDPIDICVICDYDIGYIHMVRNFR